MKKLLIAIILFAAMQPVSVFAVNTDSLQVSKSYYYAAKQQLQDMLDGKSKLSYEQAIYIIENAWWDNKINYKGFNAVIDNRVKSIKDIAEQYRSAPIEEKKDNFYDQLRSYRNQGKDYYNKALFNWAIYAYMTDSLLLFKNDSVEIAIHRDPFRYSTNDPLGTSDWSNTQITNLLLNGRGNCFALVSLYKIFSEKLNTNADICTAPGHVYICHKDDKGTTYNIELSSHSFPGIGTLETLTYTTDAAVKNDISLRELDLKQSVALCLVYLAKGYEYKFKEEGSQFAIECAEQALKYDSLNLNAMLLKAEVLEMKLLSKNRTVPQLQSDTVFNKYQKLISRLYALGYREMPLEMKNQLIKGFSRDSVTTLFTKEHRPHVYDHLGVQYNRYASLSWGLFDEEIKDKPYEKYSRTIFNAKTKKIVKFVNGDILYNDYNFDPVVFAWNVDPMAYKYPHASPYCFVEDNPISRIDPDGADWIVATTKGKDGSTQIHLTFAGAVLNSSGKNIDMQKFMAGQVKTFEKVFGQGNVHAEAHLRQVSSVKDLKWHESLIDVQAGGNFAKNKDGSVVGGDSRYGGKYIRINADGINNDGSLVDKKTVVHEIGHTGGLVHPWEFDNHTSENFVNGNPFSVGVQGFYNSGNDLNLDANFMGYSTWGAKQGSINPMLSDDEKINYFNNNVGNATQGQEQQVINNLYEGNLNSDKDLPKK